MNKAPKHIRDNFNKALNGEMSDFDWATACDKFYIGNSTAYKTNIGGRSLYIESREQMNKSVLWVVKMDNHWVLGKDSKFHNEPQPSSRTVKFIDLTRFATKEEALESLVHHEKENKGKNPTLYA